MEPSDKPLFFISHKHEDALIAEKIVSFVRSLTAGRVEVYLSSNPRYEGPRIGKPLNDELKKALWRAAIVILVYTTADKDWSWCLWECGLADDPTSPVTKVVVFQCRDDQPEMFQGYLHARAWLPKSLTAFAKRFRENDFCPGGVGPLTELSERELETAAEDLHAELRGPIALLKAETWSAWPFLRIELERSGYDQAMTGTPEEQLAAIRRLLLQSGKIVASSGGSPQLFGKTEVEQDTTVGDLVTAWQERQPGRTTEWLDVIARQILYSARKNVPQVKKWPRFREVNADDEFVPGVGRVKSHPTAFQFDCYFYSVAQVPQVTSVMTYLDRMYCVDLSRREARTVLLRELLVELELQNWNRIPVLDSGRVRYIVHMSMIDRFLRKAAYVGGDVSSMTLADLFAAESMQQMFKDTFAVVAEEATVCDADLAMRAIHRCEDVFVTPSGSREEPVSGWLTDWDIDRALSP